jgi:hypothetical protein
VSRGVQKLIPFIITLYISKGKKKKKRRKEKKSLVIFEEEAQTP